ncbi:MULTISPECIES: GatB/YqeY domain-containing protein [Sulfurospirillum]|uniref:YqeY-like protein n=3 Tax=Sulfurospirillum TaxID=57665 RepID=A0A1D7TJX1_9BACT|nr:MULTISPECIES: GatB/YqeY domain-containing protein [Sulfurospirillum]AHJ12745.1 YqeY-like protein [Sulfurospirillum multivorans DSM 12446]AOO65230.1 YqeY-like protein [Sulfurospirillum halorespirans DSM 13726]QEH06240.1 YqeY-like protein [Sulfurospirillum multivorans]
MSQLKTKLQDDLKEAMKTKDNFKRDVIRFLMSALKQIEVDERKELSDADIMKIIQKSLKQRDDASTAFKEADRMDLYDKEMAEAAILKSYLPQQLDDEALKIIVQKHIQSSGATSLKEIGKIMAGVLAECEGVADGKRINAIAKELLI